MSDPYERWLASRAEGAVPDGFADRVVSQAARMKSVDRVPLWIAAAAGVAFVVRVASLFLVFVTR